MEYKTDGDRAVKHEEWPISMSVSESISAREMQGCDFGDYSSFSLMSTKLPMFSMWRHYSLFLSDPGPRCPWSDLWIRVSLTHRPFADLTDVTLADEDTNSILTDNANRTFQGNMATRVTQPGGLIWNQAMQVT